MNMNTNEKGMIDRTGVASRHPWPEGTYLQGGARGLVLGPDGTRTTAFVEAFPDDSFFRGEGETVEDAEDAAWASYQRKANCPGHEWEARNYRNGGGICKHCGSFGSQVFTPEQLGCYCATCGVPTFWSRQNDEFFCQEHATDRDSEWFRKRRADGALNTTGSQLSDIFGLLGAFAQEEEDENDDERGSDD